jgi:hypothetical protein
MDHPYKSLHRRQMVPDRHNLRRQDWSGLTSPGVHENRITISIYHCNLYMITVVKILESVRPLGIPSHMSLRTISIVNKMGIKSDFEIKRIIAHSMSNPYKRLLITCLQRTQKY